MEILGVDIGGSGMKALTVNTDTGELTSERHRLKTPSSGKPDAMLKTLRELLDTFDWKGPVGCTFPGVIRKGEIFTSANLHDSWIGKNLEAEIENITGQPAAVLNDADAAGLAEVHFGAGKNQAGLIFLCTIGTGLGTVFAVDGKLVPNCELGHVLMKHPDTGKFIDAEKIASNAARKSDDLGWKEWALRFNDFLQYVYDLFWPELVILGGGTAKKHEKFLEYLALPVPVTIAELKNHAGMAGAALAAAEKL
jgi:polyphosphate glucokinase